MALVTVLAQLLYTCLNWLQKQIKLLNVFLPHWDWVLGNILESRKQMWGIWFAVSNFYYLNYNMPNNGKQYLWVPADFIWTLVHVINLFSLLSVTAVCCFLAGISGKSQILFALVFTTRYLDLLTSFISFYNTTMKVKPSRAFTTCVTISLEHPLGWACTFNEHTCVCGTSPATTSLLFMCS